MKWVNKIISILLAITVMVLLIPSEAVFASDGTIPTISVQSQTGKAGEEVEVDVLVSNNPGIAGAILQVEYDSKLTLQSVTNGDALSALTFTKPAHFSSPSKFLWDSESGMSQIDGILLKMKFLISDQAKPGDELPVGVSYGEGDIFNEDLQDVSFALVNGKVTVAGSSSGGDDGNTGQPDTGDQEKDPSITDAKITVENGTGKIGDTVELKVTIGNNPGIAGATLQIEYDSKLSLQEVINGDALDVLTFTKPAKLTSPCKFLWDSESGMALKDGTLLTLRFAISNQSIVGDKLPVHISYEEGDIFDENLEDIELQCVDGTITVEKNSDVEKEELAHLYGASLRLTGDIGVNFYYEFTEQMLNDSSARVFMTVGDQKNEFYISDAEVDTKAVAGKTLYKFTCYVKAKQMKDNIVVQAKADGYEGESRTYSIRQYADNILAGSKYSDELKYLVRVMMQYGASAQKYLNYSVSDLATDGLNMDDIIASANALKYEDLSSYVMNKTDMPDGISVYGANLSLKSETVLRYHFTLDEGHDISEYTFAVGNREYSPVMVNNRYCIEIDNIRAQDIDEMFEVTVSDFHGASGTVSYGVLTYARNIIGAGTEKYSQELIDTVRSLYMYNCAAENYLKTK